MMDATCALKVSAAFDHVNTHAPTQREVFQGTEVSQCTGTRRGRVGVAATPPVT